MIVACPSCASRFQYDENRFQGAPAKRFRCPKCSHVFEVANPLLVPAFPTPVEPLVAPTGTFDAPRPFSGTARSQPTPYPTSATAEAPPRGMRFTLAFLNGPHASTVRVLEQTRLVIGREEGDLATMDPETSRRHALLEIHHDGSVWLTDLNSTNGTLVEGQRIEGTVQLMDRQEFTCGKSTFMLLVRIEDGMEG